MDRTMIRVLFYLAAAYDGLLGALFLFLPITMFQWYGVTPPNHPGYIQFPAMLIILFGVMFFAIAGNPEGNRNLIPYGVGLKLSYSSVVFWYWFTVGVPGMWKPFAVIDALMAALFIWAYLRMGSGR
jgi:hypothetical protein